MSNAEIDETQLSSLKTVNDTVKKMLANPAARKLLLQAQKTIDPNTPIPELDAAAPVLEAVGAIKKEFEDFKGEMTAKELKREQDAKIKEFAQKWSQGQASARAEGYDKDGLEKLEAFMVENGIVDHEIGIAAFERKYPPAVPVASINNRFDPFKPATNDNTDPMAMLLAGDDNSFLNTSIQSALSDIRSGTGRR